MTTNDLFSGWRGYLGINGSRESRRDFLKTLGIVGAGFLVFGADSCSNPSSPQPTVTITVLTSSPPTPSISQPSSPPVPGIYQSLYSQLKEYLDSDNQVINSLWDGSIYPVNYAAELLTADANAGPGILQTSSQQVMMQELDGVQLMGVKAVTIQTGFPIFEPAFYRASGQSDSEAQASVQTWLSYYQSIVQAVHARGMKLIVESNPLLSSFISSQSSFNPGDYFKSLDFSTYKTGRSKHNLIVAEQIKPDYLLLQTEPDTDAANDFRPELNDPSQDVPMIKQFVQDLENSGIAGIHSFVQLGAGAGTWQPLWQQYISGFAAIPGLDKLDTHIYNLPPNINQIGELQVAMKIADLAHAAGKGVSLSEFWAHKSINTNPYSGQGDPIIEVRVRDLFSFWAPLDAQFLSLVAKLANYKHFDYVSGFGHYNWFALIDYDSLKQTPIFPATGATQNAVLDDQITSNQTQLAKQSLANHQTSLTGKAYQTVINTTPIRT